MVNEHGLHLGYTGLPGVEYGLLAWRVENELARGTHAVDEQCGASFAVLGGYSVHHVENGDGLADDHLHGYVLRVYDAHAVLIGVTAGVYAQLAEWYASHLLV